MKILSLIVLSILVFSSPAMAEDKRELILEMLEVTEAKKNHNLVIESYIKQFAANPVTATDGFKTYFREALAWDALIEPMINIYEESYTVEELKALNQFFSSAVGKSFISKAPEVNEKSTAIIMGNIHSAMKHIQSQN